MKTKELLLECKIKLAVQTDYKLAQQLEIPRARISDYMAGRRRPDTYGTTRIALCLGRDPAMIAAEIEVEAEKNPIRAAFWRDFLARASTHKSIMLALLYGGTLFIAGTPSASNAVEIKATSHNVWLRKKRHQKAQRVLTNSHRRRWLFFKSKTVLQEGEGNDRSNAEKWSDIGR